MSKFLIIVAVILGWVSAVVAVEILSNVIPLGTGLVLEAVVVFVLIWILGLVSDYRFTQADLQEARHAGGHPYRELIGLYDKMRTCDSLHVGCVNLKLYYGEVNKRPADQGMFLDICTNFFNKFQDDEAKWRDSFLQETIDQLGMRSFYPKQ